MTNWKEPPKLRTCSKCGNAEQLDQPFIDGVCIDCVRKEEEAKSKPKLGLSNPPAPVPVLPVSISLNRFNRPQFQWTDFGWILFAAGLIMTFLAWSSDTTVDAGGEGIFRERVHNTGLMQQQLIGCTVGAMMASVGLLIAVLGRLLISLAPCDEPRPFR